MVVDCLMKLVHFFLIIATYTTTQVVDFLFKEIFILHGLPQSIVSDRDNRSMSHSWQELLRLYAIELTLSTSYHP